MDDEGLDPDALELPAPRFLYTIPTFQNPSGRTLSLERRARARRARARGQAARSSRTTRTGSSATRASRCRRIYELAGGEGVVYSSSFSKIVAPGLRVGYFVGPAELVARLEALAVQTYLTPALLPQATVYEFVSRGPSSRTSSASSALLRERRDAMLEALERELPEGATWSRPEGGYFLWVDFPDGTTRRAARAATERRRHVRRRAATSTRPAEAGGVSAARLQLRLAGGDLGGSRASFERSPCSSCARCRWRYSCESSTPPTIPTARERAGSPRSAWTFASPKTKSIVELLVVVLDDERDQVADRDQQQADPDPEPRLPGRRLVFLRPEAAGCWRRRLAARGVPANSGVATAGVLTAAILRGCDISGEGASGRGTSRGCGGGTSTPRSVLRNVGHGRSRGERTSPALWK